MSSRPVAILDSGIGGLPYLAWLQENLPLETLIYVADTANFPYGEKKAEAVRDLVLGLAQSLVTRYQPKLLLVACNTASVLALDALRQSLTIPVVGVVPAVKTAASLGQKTVGVLATPRTVEDGYWEELVRRYAPERRVKGYAAPDLVRLVEEGASEQEKEGLLAAWAKTLKADDVDAVVLGCTHYLHLTGDLERHLGPGVAVVDSRDGVGRQVSRVLKERGLQALQREGSDLFHFTSQHRWSRQRLEELDHRYRAWADRFHLQFAGAWETS